MIIRIATKDDLNDIDKIYNQAIATSRATADTVSFSKEERLNWYKSHDPGKFPVFVAEEMGNIVGYGYFTAYRGRRFALRYVAEISYFVHEDQQRRGIGSSLMEYALKVAHELHIRHLIAILIGNNNPSIGLLKKYGFTQWGLLPGIVDFNGVEHDHLYYGRRLR